METQQPRTVSQASVYDSLRVFQTLVVPTLAKGVIKRRPWIEALAQHLGLDTDAVQLLQELRKKYGSGPLLLWLPFRSQVVLLDPKDVSQVLSHTPLPFTSATKEKKSSLSHFEPNHILIAGPQRRAVLRPVHETALATSEQTHPLTDHIADVINQELQTLFQSSDKDTTNIDWPTFSTVWYRIIRRVVLGDAARDDETITTALDDIRRRANWGFLAPANQSKLDSVHAQLERYIASPEPGSLVSRLPEDPSGDLHLPSQIAHWLFAFDPAGIATFRALALLGCHTDTYQTQAAAEARSSGGGRRPGPLSRAIFLESVRLWPTTPAILRELDADSQLAGHGFAKGTGFVIFTPFFHRDGETLEFAHRLEPGQWMDGGGGKGDVDLARALLPFSGGPAVCPAHNLVPMVGALGMEGLLRMGRVELVKPAIDPEKLPGTLDHTEVELRVEGPAVGGGM